ncbi:hypothetical protein BCR43DRAFT_532171 [Syncephalastrum racemosum]|uniref:Uncharacterized protein n=1 Tax=Syncephalastrum racemosum TaxID=13706 RepID=A0A1X2H6T2_SYNRA|nr:hypothetical protein BCR43DRAFT_532171 [Syncephalastrum racemosum]
MTLGRQRGGRRAQTVPVPVMPDIFPSSIEESLQDWLKQRSQPDSPESPQPAEGICECCRQPDCPHFEALASTIRKLEGDTRLAAEIGQSLLHKHEAHALESTRIKQDLERQILQETAADLEAANARCTHLTTELRARTMEVDKLRIFKFMVRQADIREENLRAKLEDAKQELAVSRKAELTLESKHKKFMAKYGMYVFLFWS